MSKIINQIRPSTETEIYKLQDFGVANSEQFKILSSLINTGAASAGQSAIALGSDATAKDYSIAIGNKASAQKSNTFAFGDNAIAIETGAIAFGNNARAEQANSVAIGQGTCSNASGQFVCGKYNVVDPNAIFIVGNGQNEADKSSIFSVGSSKLNFNNEFIFEIATENPKSLIFKDGSIVRQDAQRIDLKNSILCLSGSIKQNEAFNQPCISIAIGGEATDSYSFAIGEGIVAPPNQFAIGKYNVKKDCLFIIGNGDPSTRSNIVEVSNSACNINGTLTCASPNLNTRCVRNIIIGTTAPTTSIEAEIGDIYLWYSETQEATPEETQNEVEV